MTLDLAKAFNRSTTGNVRQHMAAIFKILKARKEVWTRLCKIWDGIR